MIGAVPGGQFVEPTIFTDVDNTMRIAREEVFGPVVVLAPFKDFAQALEMANDTAYGLQAGVFTKDLAHAWQAFETLEVGGVIINDSPTFRVDHMPYGGVKASGFGREGLRYAIEEMSELKLLTFNSR